MPEFSQYTNNTSTNTQRASRNDIRLSENGFAPKTPETNSLLQTSTNIFVFANGSVVGMVQSFSVSENRNINKLQAIGWEGVVQAVPSNTTGGQLNVNRIALYESSIWNALGLTDNGVPYNPLGTKVHDVASNNLTETHRSGVNSASNLNSSRMIFKTLKDQRVPLEIQVKTRMNGKGEEYYIETYVDCWLQSYSKSYTVGQITVAEQAAIQYADVY